MASITKKRAEKEIAKLESGIPVDEEDIKHSVSVPFKNIEVEKIERAGEKKKTTTRRTRKPGRTKREKMEKKSVNYKTRTPKETNLKKGEKIIKVGNRKIKIEKPRIKAIKTGGHILIITEKPQAALKIAGALGDYRKYSDDGIPYYELERDGEKIVVAAAVGHLFTINQKSGETGFPIFKLEWIPSYLKKAEFTKKYYFTLLRLVKDAKEFIVATDYDIEGEVIGLNVVRFICEQKDAERMKFSSLTKNELEKAYDTRSKTLDWGQAIAGETRHYLDWMYGINLSRALMVAIKAAGAFRIMSIGRVQGPALALVVDKELEIKKFKSTPYWQIFVEVNGIWLKYIKDIIKKNELDRFKDLKGKFGKAETKTEQEHIMPPAPFDLTTLQTEAYRFFGINPGRTLQIAQQLYLQGIISYPRTSSQKIPNVIDVKSIFKKLSNVYSKEVEMAIRIKPVEGGKSDPAHPSIYPTGELGKLTSEQEKIYDLIVRRFISCFCEDAIVENKKISFEVEGLRFLAKGLQIKKKAWMNVYKAKIKEEKLKDLNGKYKVDEVKIEEKETMPPKRYTQASLVRELEKRNLGTKATRASIIETLYNRGYVKGQSIEATELGISLISTLKKHSPIIIDEKLTRNFEKEIEAIQQSKKDLNKKEEKVLEEAKSAIFKISERFKKEDKEIGGELVKANNKHVEKLREENIIMDCPVCRKGKLRISYGKMYGRYFVACNAYPKCKTTFSLPPNGLIKTTDKTCEKCNFPMLMRISKGRRPWIFCFNPECKTNEEWVKKRKDYKK